MFHAEFAEVAKKKISVLCALAPSPELWSVGDCENLSYDFGLGIK